MAERALWLEGAGIGFVVGYLLGSRVAGRKGGVLFGVLGGSALGTLGAREVSTASTVDTGGDDPVVIDVEATHSDT